ncbi:MAG: hypothetical protein AAES65_10250 [Candidatus Thiodiazotropha sp. (ex. Lucinoma kazani)]
MAISSWDGQRLAATNQRALSHAGCGNTTTFIAKSLWSGLV